MKIGLLPFWLNLYDEFCPQLRTQQEEFVAKIANEYRKRNIELEIAQTCMLEEDFTKAVNSFESSRVTAIVTLHLAYSPSLESANILAKTQLPLIILDTTPQYDFGPDQQASEIMLNHGIHGVQDMCNLLVRNGRKFYIEAGHWEGDVIDRTLDVIKAIEIADNIRKSRVGIIGKPFPGMGDFAIPFQAMEDNLGIEVIKASPEDMVVAKNMCNLESIEDIIAENTGRFDTSRISEKDQFDCALTEGTINRWLEENRLTAFTFCFLDIDSSWGLPMLPFVAASKAMSKGIGYAGEGDVLTAAFMGAVSKVLPETSFTEMFCPDWQGNRIFMSHMGEIGLNACNENIVMYVKKALAKSSPDSAILCSCLKPGKTALVNLAPVAEDKFRLLYTEVEVVDSSAQSDTKDCISGWIKPHIVLNQFLEEYSKWGATHHSIIVYGSKEKIFANLAEIMGWQFVKI